MTVPADARPDDDVRHARATVRPEKATAVAELADAFRTASATVLTEYRGLTVKQVTQLRVALGGDTTYSVVKNTLTRRAATDAGLEGLEELLVGPTAVAFVKGDPVEAAKGLRDYARANPALVIKGGVMDGRALSADEIRQLADLESREVLLARLAGGLQASLSRAVYLFAAPLSQAARLAAALRDKAQEDPSVLRGGAGVPAPSAGADAGGDAQEPAPPVQDGGTGTAAAGITPTAEDLPSADSAPTLEAVPAAGSAATPDGVPAAGSAATADSAPSAGS